MILNMLKILSYRAGRAAILLAMLVVPATAASAQAYPASIGEDASAKLARNLRILGTSPREFSALIAAGQASLELGDTQAAAGFFGRAEEVWPQSPLPQTGMGAAMVAMGDPRGALNYFARAQALGASHASIAVERGLAFDLIGDQAKAQSDYRAALNGPNGNEARRRLALSLAISRDIRGAAQTIEPLLVRRDPAALRINAFVLALAGDREGARRTIDAAMPGAGARFEPFFQVLPVLRPAEKAAAVHLGEFPKDAAQRYAQAQPIPSSPVFSIGNSAPPRQTVTAQRSPPRAIAQSKPVKVAEAPRRAVRQAPAPSTYLGMVRPSLDPSRYASTRRPKTQATRPQPQGAAADPEPRPADRLDDIARMLSAPPEAEPILQVTDAEPILQVAEADTSSEPVVEIVSAELPPEPGFEIEIPPAPEPKLEAPAKMPVKLASKATKAAEMAKPAKPQTRHFVQLASGSNADRLPGEFKKIRARKPSLFSGRTVQVSRGKDLFRLVVGPFKTSDDSRAFVNQLAKAGIDGFSYTAPDGLKFEKIATR